MAELRFQDFRFEDKPPVIRIHFLKLYYFDIPQSEFTKWGEVTATPEVLTVKGCSQEKLERQFSRMLLLGFEHLRNKVTGNPTQYIHKNSGIPLIGTLAFGIVDKGSNMIEVKPLTGCNADCTFCSVDEGPSSKKISDIVIEKDYLVEEVRKLLAFKDAPVQVYLNPHGEPTLYAELVPLVQELSHMKEVAGVHLITNMMLVSKEMADKLIEAGLSSLNVSFHALDAENAKKLFHTRGYNIEKVKSVLEHVKGRIEVILAPVYLKGINEQDVEDIVAYGKEHGFTVMVQNFLQNKRGRNPAKEIPFDQFSVFLKGLEEKYGISLLNVGKVGQTKELPVPFHTDEVIDAELVFPGRYRGEWYAVAKGRVLLVKGDFAKKGKQRVKITKDLHNIFYAMKA